MDKKITKTSELAKELGFDEAERKSIDEQIDNRSVSRKLTVLRAKSGLSQAEIAKKLNTSQSSISKLEYATDDQIKIDEMSKYLAALGYEMTIAISKPQNIAQKIRNSYNHLILLFRELQKYAVNDEDILEGIADFELEATKNMLNLASSLIESSSSKIKKIEPREEPKVILNDYCGSTTDKNFAGV